MNKAVIWKLKKYLFYISILFGILTLSHLIYVYLYSDYKEVPIKWGTISEWIIWEMPHFNPLVPSSNHNRYISYLLYRSLLRYDPKKWKIVSDLASCNTDNLLYIECYIEDNIKWSDWESITIDDIASTLNLLKESDINPLMKSLLKNVTIEKKEWAIAFTNTKKDINFLNVFFQPIMPDRVINSLSQEELAWKMPYNEGIYSWRYKLSSVSQDASLWITKIVFDKNKYYVDDEEIYIDQIILKLFTDKLHFLKNKTSVNIFNDKSNIIWESIPRLEPINYTLSQFVWLFINKDKISDEKFRSIILDSIDRKKVIEDLWEENVKEIKNPFLTDIELPFKKDKDTNLEELLAKQGYFSKQYLMNKVVAIEERDEKLISKEANPEEKTKLIQKDSKVIVSPEWTKKYNFVSEDDIKLQWQIEDKTIEAIYVNDYKLQQFKKWDSYFFYRLSTDPTYNSMKEWENIYKIYSEKAWEKTLLEEVIFYYYKDKTKLEEIKKNLSEWEEEAKEEDIWNLTAFEGLEKQKIEALDDRFYYNKDLNAFMYKISYIDSDENVEKAAQSVKAMLENNRIRVMLEPVSTADLTESMIKWTSNYDMLIVWIHLGYFDFNLFPYFHSSQVWKWLNFSNLKKLSLDIMLEELKWNKHTNEEISELEGDILETIWEEKVLKTLYTPKLKILIDKNIKNFNINETVPENIYRYDSIISSYLIKKKIIDFNDKWVSDFVRFIFSTLF